MKKNKIKLILVAIIAVVAIVATLLVINNKINKKSGQEENKNYEKYVSFDSRIEKMKNYEVADAEIFGWLQVQGTNIDYPVIKKTNAAYASGIDYIWISSNYKVGENRQAIYGHNILNVSDEPIVGDPAHIRFEQLMGFVYEDFAKDNLYIQYTIDGVDKLYKIYAVTFLYNDEEDGASYNDSKDIKKYIEDAKKNSIYDYDVDVNKDDDLISLITCTRYFGTLGKRTFRVDARQVRKNEKIDKYLVETNKNYDIIKKDRGE